MADYSLNQQTGNCESTASVASASVALGVIGGSIGSGSLVFLGLHLYRKKQEKKLTEGSDSAKTEDNQAVGSENALGEIVTL